MEHLQRSGLRAIFFGGEQTANSAGEMITVVWLFDFETIQWRDATRDLAGCLE
jgi:hypothetical protein